MRYVVRKVDDVIEAFWCYYTDCETCNSRFICYTTNTVIIDNCINLKQSDIINKLKQRGINVKKLVEF